MNNKNVLITGSTGLVGSHLSLELLASGGYTVHCAVRSEKSFEKLRKVYEMQDASGFEQLKIHYCDIESTEEVFALLREIAPKIIYQCAAEVDLTDGQEERLIRNNVNIVNSIGGAALRYSRECDSELLFLHISSIAALGSAPKGEAVSEDTLVSNIAEMSPYGKSKFLSENEVWRLSKMGLRVSIVNPAVIIGRSGGGGGLNAMYRLLSKGLAFYTDAKMGFVGVRDVARAMRMIGENQSEGTIAKRFILCSHNLEYRDFIGLFNSHCGRRRPWFRVPKWLLCCGIWLLGVWSKMVGCEPLISLSMIGFMTERATYNGGRIVENVADFSYSEKLRLF